MSPDIRLVAVDSRLWDRTGLRPVSPAELARDGVRLVEVAPRNRKAWGIDWRRRLGSIRYVLVSDVPPRVARSLYRPPMRYLGVGPVRRPPIPDGINGLDFTHAPHPELVDGLASEKGWPTIDVLHLSLPARGVDDDGSVPEPDGFAPGQLGWLERLTVVWKTRLLLLTVEDDTDLGPALVLGGALADRGGPLVFVGGQASFDRTSILQRLVYGDSVDDMDDVLDDLSVIGGQGREHLFDLRPIQRRLVLAEEPELSELSQLMIDFGEKLEEPTARRYIADEVALTFSRHAPREPPGGPPETVRRDTQIQLRRAGSTHTARLSTSDRLVPGRPYDLEVSVADRPDGAAFLDRSSPLEVLLPRGRGVWVEVGLTPIDIDVTGSLTQHLWIPASGPGPPAVFRVVPHDRDLVAFRVTLYANKHVLRSYRLVARASDDEHVVDRFAAALVVSRRAVAKQTWAIRQEFAGIERLDDAPELGVPAPSLVVNLLDDRQIVTVNLKNRFTVSSNANKQEHGGQLRLALATLQINPIAGTYRFPDHNLGSAAVVDTHLVALAQAGWSTFTALIPDAEARQAFRDDTDGTPIQIVETELRDVPVPWAAVYDAEVHPAAELSVCHALDPVDSGDDPLPSCGQLAGCRVADSVDPRTVICPRHFWGFRTIVEQPLGGMIPDGAVRLESTNGILTGPPAPGTKARGAEPPMVALAGAARALVAVNALIGGADDHAKTVAAALGSKPWFSAHPPAPITGDNEVYEALRPADLDFLYLYCHAVGGTLDRSAEEDVQEPRLRFGPGDTGLPASALHGERWPSGPIVVLNGCHTAAFRPDSTSPFLQAVSEGRGAQAVVLTEISVHPTLAEEAGLGFAELVVAGYEVGAAMRTVRRRLLGKSNPCGLVYTVYGDRRLTMHGSAGG